VRYDVALFVDLLVVEPAGTPIPATCQRPDRRRAVDVSWIVLSYRVSGRAGGVVTFAPYQTDQELRSSQHRVAPSMTAIDITLTNYFPRSNGAGVSA
jgi:hypothetical protein